MKKSNTVFLASAALLVVVLAVLFVRFGLRHGVDQSEMMHAAFVDDPAQLQSLIAQGASVNAIDSHSGITPLMFASQRGNVGDVKVLLRAGANIGARANRTNMTPLMFAAWKGRPEVVRVLLDHKASINSVNSEGRTALGMALASQRLPSQRNSPTFAQTIALLHQAGAK